MGASTIGRALSNIMPTHPSRFAKKGVPFIEEIQNADDFADYDEMTFSDISATCAPSSSTRNEKKHGRMDKTSKTTLSKADIGKLMDVTREQAQSTAISQENRGFKLLQKFGYNASQGGLGKQNTGLSVPLAVEKREATDRAGLGVNEVKKRKREESVAKEDLKDVGRQRVEQDFKAAQKLQQLTFTTLKHLTTARKIILELDFRSGVSSNDLWPSEISDDLDNPDDRPSFDSPPSETQGNDALLQQCLDYLAKTYFYCIHCGVQYGSSEDFNASCPGPGEDDH